MDTLGFSWLSAHTGVGAKRTTALGKHDQAIGNHGGTPQ
jgi:hypothetical protein